MQYKFVLAALTKLPNVVDWKLEITPDNIICDLFPFPKQDSALENANKRWLDSYARYYFEEPHINIESYKHKKKDGTLQDNIGVFYAMISHPQVLNPLRSEGIQKLLAKGQTVYINRNGGYSSAEGYTVLEVIEKEELVFPKSDDKEEYIVISRYPGAKHYYLSSNFRGRIFDKNPFNNKESAFEEALKYVNKSQIKIKTDTFAYQNIGD